MCAKRAIGVFVFLFVLVSGGAARADESSAAPSGSRRVTVQLQSGERVVGTLVADSPTDVVLVTDAGAVRKISKADVAMTTNLPFADRVLLEDGTWLSGTVSDVKPGESLILEDADGARHMIAWTRVRDVVTHPKRQDVSPAARKLIDEVAAGRKVSTTTALKAGRDGASLDITRECSGGTECHEKTHVGVDGDKGFVASYESKDDGTTKRAEIDATGGHAELERDCAKNPSDERCTERGSLNLGRNGLSAGYTRESVERVRTPRSGTVNVQLDAGMGYGFGSLSGGHTTILEIPIDLTIPILLGGRLPGDKGGSWVGLRFEPTAGAILMDMSMSSSGINSNGALFGYRIGATLALQYLSFGTLNEKNLQQKGFGVALGAFAGVQGMNGSLSTSGSVDGFTFASSQSISSHSSSYGPTLALTFPKYNAGTAKYSATNILFMILPTGSLTFAMASVGVSF
jgi:hypothetical protein